MTEDQARQEFFDQLGRPWMADEMFDAVPDCVFFVKDRMGKYVAVNQTLVERCGRENKGEVIGRTARELFPEPLGESFTEQDFEVIQDGRSIRGQLELHLYPSGRQGWCLTWKEPVTNHAGAIVGVAGISRDLPARSELSSDLEAIASVLSHINEHLSEPLSVTELADLAGLSSYQLDQRIKSLFDVSTGQYITRRRIERACHLLDRTDESLSSIALDCGYSDQSAFTRQFRQSVGIPPGAYRARQSPG